MEKQFIAFKVSNFYYCIDIMDVQEVVRESYVTHMPNFPSFVEGVINLRGVVIPIISINKRLCSSSLKTLLSGLEEFDSYVNSSALVREEEQIKSSKNNSLQNGVGYKLIVIKVGAVTIGLLVDVLDKILMAEEHEIQSAAGLGRSLNHSMVTGVLHQDEEIFVVLNVQGILAGDEENLLTAQLQQ